MQQRQSKTLTGKKVALVCEAFSRNASGGRAALAIARALQALDVEVVVFVSNLETPLDLQLGKEFRVRSVPPFGSLYRRLRSHLTTRTVAARRFLLVGRTILSAASRGRLSSRLRDFRPDAVQFCSFNFDKPAFLYQEAAAVSPIVILQPWIHRFACAQGFGYRGGSECDLCFDRSFANAKRKGCATGFRGSAEGFLRERLAHAVLHETSWWASGSTDMDSKLIRYGAAANRIVRLPLPFDSQGLEHLPTSDNGRLAFHGSWRDYKGVAVIKTLLEAWRDCPLTIYSMPGDERNIRESGIDPRLHPLLRIETRYSWGNGLESELAASSAVLVPSLWPTTPEYSLLESLALGKAVIAFRIGSHIDYLADRVSAMLSSPGDLHGYVEACKEIHADHLLRARVARGAKEVFERVWRSDSWLASCADMYEAVLLRGGSSTRVCH